MKSNKGNTPKEVMFRNWQKEEFIKKMTEERRGEKNPNWKGGKWKRKNVFIDKIRRLQIYTEWKNIILKRDVNTYPKIPKGLQVHHIKSVERIIQENNIITIEEAKKCKELWDVNNGNVLTSGEHMIITWLNRKKRSSLGFILYLEFFIKEYKHNIYDWCKINKAINLDVNT